MDGRESGWMVSDEDVERARQRALRASRGRDRMVTCAAILIAGGAAGAAWLLALGVW
jgi:hypothetical protein